MTTSRLVRETEGQVRIDARSVVVDHEPDAAGICWTTDTVEAAAGSRAARWRSSRPRASSPCDLTPHPLAEGVYNGAP